MTQELMVLLIGIGLVTIGYFMVRYLDELADYFFSEVVGPMFMLVGMLMVIFVSLWIAYNLAYPLPSMFPKR